jgi:hypothetical protein
MLTVERLREQVHYDPETGIFTWLIHSRSTPVGKIVGYPSSRGYIRIGIDRKSYRAQRLAWLYMTGEWPVIDLDHINGIPSDNRWMNLRQVDQSKNQRNQKLHKDSRSGLKGVRRNGKRWMSAITVNRRQIYLGTFDTPEDAHEIYCEAAVAHFGEHARFF